MRKLVLLAWCVVLATCLSTGCGKVNTTAVTPVKVYNQTAPIPELKIDETRKVTLPQGYPKNIVPLFEGGKLLAASKREDTKNNDYFFVSFSLDTDVKEVGEYYQDYFKGDKGIHKIQMDKSYSFKGALQNKLVSVTCLPNKVNGKSVTLVTITVYPKQ